MHDERNHSLHTARLNQSGVLNTHIIITKQIIMTSRNNILDKICIINKKIHFRSSYCTCVRWSSTRLMWRELSTAESGIPWNNQQCHQTGKQVVVCCVTTNRVCVVLLLCRAYYILHIYFRYVRKVRYSQLVSRTHKYIYILYKQFLARKKSFNYSDLLSLYEYIYRGRCIISIYNIVFML